MDIGMHQLVWLAAILLAAGVFTGILAGLLGVGGGIIAVPVIYQVLVFTDTSPAHLMHIAVGTSLALIIPTSIRSARAHHARGAVLPAVLRRWSVPLVLGVSAGVWLATLLHSAFLALVFAGVVLAMSAYLGFAGDGFRLGTRLPEGLRGAAIPATVGAVSALMGIGGGSLSVPAMTAYGIPVLHAVGTSAAFGLLIAVPGALGFMLTGWQQPGLPPLSLGYVNLLAFACLLPTTLLAVPLGVRLAHRIPGPWLRRSFALFLLLMGLRMAWAGLKPFLS